MTQSGDKKPQKKNESTVGKEVRKILVPIKGQPSDDEALRIACELAKKPKAEVHAFHVIEVDRRLPIDAVIESEIEKAEQILTHAELVASEVDYEIETDLVQSREAGPSIVDEAVEGGYDLIVMGMIYKKRFGMFHLGEAIPYVLESAPCRVILCRITAIK
ncbi:MAG TPA: universal stress protein [Dehalococcoidia bacterium]|nr:universal stress protein [Dehalococcoidia bacterium]